MYWHRQSLHAGPNSNLRFFHQGLQFGLRFGFEPSISCSRRNRIQILPYQWLVFEDGPRTVEQADDVLRQNRGRRYASLPAASAWSTMEEIEAKAQKRTADGKRKPRDAKERRSDLLNSPKKARLHENEGNKPVGQERLRLFTTIKAKPRRIGASRVQPDAQEARNYHFLEFLHAGANAEEQGLLKWFCERQLKHLRWHVCEKTADTLGDFWSGAVVWKLLVLSMCKLACVHLNFEKWALLWVIISVPQSHEVTVAACSSMVDMLCSLLGSSRVPRAIALILVDLIVEFTLRFGRWLWALSPETLPCLEVAYAASGGLSVEQWWFVRVWTRT